MDTVRIETPGYAITVAPGLLDQVGAVARETAPAHRYAIITDATVARLYAPRVAVQFPGGAEVLTIPAGEASKSREQWGTLTDQMLTRGFTRDSAVIALGGGVVGDLAGFVAATFMRGIPFIQVPTTLLAMIDASIGGKTGVDTPAGKNLVGAFHPPRAVVIDPEVLDTLELSQWRGGLAEAVKHGVVADEAYFELLGEAGDRLLRPLPAARDRGFRDQVVTRSIQIKADVVTRDEREQGVRKILNFGHTVGHAVELLSGFSLSHGEAVAIGMVLESAAGERSGITTSGTMERLTETLTRLGLPSHRPHGPSAEVLLEVMRTDKKSRGGAIQYAIPTRIGVMAGGDTGYGVLIQDTVMREVLG